MQANDLIPMGELAVPSRPALARGEPLALSWQWPRGMFGVSIANFLLRFVTLGIYHFWGKTEVRRRIWSAIRLNGEPLTYTGTGGELFFGFVIVAVAVFLPLTLVIIGVMIAFGPESMAAQIVPMLFYIPMLFLIGVAIYRATRYRLARTRWRGIRGALAGHSGRYGWTFFWTLLVAIITLGWAMPWRATKLQRMQVANMQFGNRPMRFDAASGPLYGPFATVWFGTIILYGGAAAIIWSLIGDSVRQSQATGQPVPPEAASIGFVLLTIVGALLLLGIVAAWYRARLFNHFANHTHFENATFSGSASAGGLIWIALTNFLITMIGGLTLWAVAGVVGFLVYRNLDLDLSDPATIQMIGPIIGPLAIFLLAIGFSILGPIAQARATGYLVRHLAVTGTAPLGEIAQAAGGDAKFGEGLAQAFDVDAF